MTFSGRKKTSEQVSNEIFTLPNIISFIRLCLIPAYFVLLLEGYSVLAAILFAIAASTDWVDGQIARRTNTVSRLGQLLDPAVDRILMITAVVGLLLVGRLPLWIILLVLLRDGLLLIGGAILLARWHIRVTVIFAGKVSTTFLFVGFALLLINLPIVPGLGIVDLAWLPGFTTQSVSLGIWFVYAGLALSVATTSYYIVTALRKLSEVRAHKTAGSNE